MRSRAAVRDAAAAAVVAVAALTLLGAGVEPRRASTVNRAPPASVESSAQRAAPAARRTFSDWSASCPFELTPPSEVSPVRWESCGSGCERMLVDWPAGDAGRIGVFPRWSSQSGAPRFAFSRLALDGSAKAFKQWIVARADGAIEMAITQPNAGSDPGCTLLEESAGKNGFAFVVRGNGTGPALRSAHDGLILADPGARSLSVAFRNENEEISGFSVGDGFLLRSVLPSRRLELIQAGTAVVLHDPANDAGRLPLSGNPPLAQGRSVFFEVGEQRLRAIHRYDPGRGAAPLLRWPASAEHGAGNIGGDGRDLVWTEAEGAADDGRYARASVMTAAYTDDPTRFRPRRLADDPNRSIGAAPFVVGCGRAAHWTPRGPLVVDLESGKSSIPEPPPATRWGRPFGLSCDELWLTAFRGRNVDIVRLKLGS